MFYLKGNGDTICNINYLKGIGVTHVLNTAEHHVEVNPAKYSCYGLQYYGFHVDDLPDANISRHFHSTTAFIGKQTFLGPNPIPLLLAELSLLTCCGRPGGAGRRAGGGELRHGLVPLRRHRCRLPHHETQHEGNQGEFTS